MSVQSALDFMEKLSQDAGLYATIKQLPRGDVDALRAAAAEAGYAFEPEDMKQAVSRIAGELGDEALDSVSGGVMLQTDLRVPQIKLPLVMRSFTAVTCGASCGSDCSGEPTEDFKL
jgi:predicted ribosomally synthesized peptide with nif11-like leader